MSNIFINEETGKRIKVYRRKIVHVYDHEDTRDLLDFKDTVEGVAQWCMENLDDDHDNYEAIIQAYDNEDWEKVIELEGCRYCNYNYEYEWEVEEVEDDSNQEV